MKLYLSSEGIGNRLDDFMRLAGDNKRVAVVANAIDHYDKYTRETRVRKEKQRLRTLGLQPEELDLRKYFGDSSSLYERLMSFGSIWCRGGNVYNLRRAMILSQFDEVAVDPIRNGDIVYGGFSAAITAISPDLFGSDIVNEPYQIPEGYPDDEPPYTALGLVDYYMAPHYETDMPWRQAVLDYVDHLRANDREVVTLRDGDVYIIERDDL